MLFPPKIKGTVVKGKQRGKKLGFPTVNLSTETFLNKLRNGVYASLIKIGKQKYKSVTHIGPAETFEEDEKKVETYIFDFEQNIYGEEVELELVKYLRGVKKFESISALVEQIKKDCHQAKEYLNENS